MKTKSSKKHSAEVTDAEKGKHSKQSGRAVGNVLGLVDDSQGSNKSTSNTKDNKKQSVEVLNQCLEDAFYGRNCECRHACEPASKRQCSEAAALDRQAKKSSCKTKSQVYTNHQSQYSNFVAEQQRLRKMRVAREQILEDNVDAHGPGDEGETQACKGAKFKYKIHLNNCDENKEMNLDDLLSSSERRFANFQEAQGCHSRNIQANIDQSGKQ
jgi:hypothetical protein